MSGCFLNIFSRDRSDNLHTEEVLTGTAVQPNAHAPEVNVPVSASVLHQTSQNRAWLIAKDVAISIPILIAVGAICYFTVHFFPLIIAYQGGRFMLSFVAFLTTSLLFTAVKENLNPGDEY